MKLCATSPLNGEYTLCGDAFDKDATDVGDEEFIPFRMAEVDERVTCEECLSFIKAVKKGFSSKGYVN